MASRSQLKQAAQLLAAAVQHQRQGDLPEATQLYRRVLKLEPANPAALGMLGAIALQDQAHEQAASFLERAVRFAAPNAALFANLGEALRRLGRREEAAAAFTRAIELAPHLAEAHYNLALTLDQMGRRAEAIAPLERALELQPALPNGVTLLLEMLRDQAEYAAALAAYAHHSPRLPASAELEAAVANVWADTFQLDEAVSHFRRALALKPMAAQLHADYATALVETGELSAAIAGLKKALELEPGHWQAHGALVYLLAFDENSDAAAIGLEARSFAQRHASGLAQASLPTCAQESRRRLRVGYLSADFRLHPSALFVPPVLREHDREGFEVYCYSNARRPDAITAQLRGLSDEWRDISALEDEAVVRLIQQDRIDVLVDLTMHCAHNRILVFARRPAPVQVCWLAYPGTTGLAEMDYRLTDPQLDPDELDEPHYSERSFLLPETFWCYEPLSAGPAVNALPALAAGYITFGSLNSFKKVSSTALALWARVLGAVPNSRMLMVAPVGQARERVLQAFGDHGIALSRVEFVEHAPRDHYLATYQRIDCCLDTAPYAGGTVSLDAFWMGVPVVTLVGRTVVGRSGASIAHNLKLPELVAHTPEQYVERATVLAADLHGLAVLRASLRGRMQGSPLMDAPRFVRHLEAAYREMWSRPGQK